MDCTQEEFSKWTGGKKLDCSPQKYFFQLVLITCFPRLSLMKSKSYRSDSLTQLFFVKRDFFTGNRIDKSRFSVKKARCQVMFSVIAIIGVVILSNHSIGKEEKCKGCNDIQISVYNNNSETDRGRIFIVIFKKGK